MPIYYQEGFNYVLHQPHEMDLSEYGFQPIIHARSGNAWVSIDEHSVLRIAATYAWGGDSGARDTRKSMRASLVHDALYQLFRIGALRPTQKHLADKVYRDILRENKTWPPRVWWRAQALRLFGANAITHERPVLVAP